MAASAQSLGTVPVSTVQVNKAVMAGESSWDNSLRNLLGMWSGPEAFSSLSPLSSFSTPSSQMVNAALLAVLGPIMSLSDDEGDYLMNTNLNTQSRILALLSLSVKRVLPCFRGGMPKGSWRCALMYFHKGHLLSLWRPSVTMLATKSRCAVHTFFWHWILYALYASLCLVLPVRLAKHHVPAFGVMFKFLWYPLEVLVPWGHLTRDMFVDNRTDMVLDVCPAIFYRSVCVFWYEVFDKIFLFTSHVVPVGLGVLVYFPRFALHVERPDVAIADDGVMVRYQGYGAHWLH